ncbi:hypothetical protein Tco_1041609 [Tanacetum coccineum]|uniref:Uncharacterized protein n=1 Tax=Tanacetum coccineum TaxID=301880 RepID=A0ABQ5GI98_9ASTR
MASGSRGWSQGSFSCVQGRWTLGVAGRSLHVMKGEPIALFLWGRVIWRTKVRWACLKESWGNAVGVIFRACQLLLVGCFMGPPVVFVLLSQSFKLGGRWGELKMGLVWLAEWIQQNGEWAGPH